MTHSEIFLQALRQRGVRITPQREMILNAFAHGDGHMTAEEIYDQVKMHTQAINIATVYRTMDMLVEVGLANCSNLRDGRQVYATRQHGPHLHLVCRSCGSTIDADAALLISFVAQVREQYQFSADWQHLSLQGVCQACQSKLTSSKEE
jgi:Fur family ferric uptake transcriptional regulator